MSSIPRPSDPHDPMPSDLPRPIRVRSRFEMIERTDSGDVSVISIRDRKWRGRHQGIVHDIGIWVLVSSSEGLDILIDPDGLHRLMRHDPSELGASERELTEWIMENV